MVTVRVRDEIPRLRRQRIARVVEAALAAGRDKDGTFRIIQYSIQGNHLHLICEADDHGALARGMQGVKIRVARGINRRLGRKGTVFHSRYEVELLDTPALVRAALADVLLNARKHGTQLGAGWADPFSSAPYFDGWARPPRLEPREPADEPPVAKPRTRLLREAWKKHGLIDPDEVPKSLEHAAARPGFTA